MAGKIHVEEVAGVELEDVEDHLEGWLLLASVRALLVLVELDGVPVDGRRHIQRLLRDALQESVLDHDLELFALSVKFRELGDSFEKLVKGFGERFVEQEQTFFVAFLLLLNEEHALQLLLLLLKRYVRAFEANDLVRLHRRELADLRGLGWSLGHSSLAFPLLRRRTGVNHRRLDTLGAHDIGGGCLDSCLLLI